MSFGAGSRRRITELSRDPKKAAAVRRTIEAVDGGSHVLRISPREQITTSVTGCPRGLKPLLLLDGEPTVSRDISHAHFCFFPMLLCERINHRREKHGFHNSTGLGDYEAELRRLIELLSTSDFYARWCANPDDPIERKQKKQLLNVLLNSPTAKCAENALYRRIRAEFRAPLG